MKKYIVITTIIVIVGLIVYSMFLTLSNTKLNESLRLYDTNFKALSLEKDSLKNEALMYKFSTEQLEYINDSIIIDLNNTRKQLAIKDKELLQMQYIKTEIHTKDSILIKDTIFRESFVGLDTTIRDRWHTVAVSLKPDKLTIDAKYISELQVFAKSSKEVLGTPKKCFVGRIFQKKYKVIRVEVYDINPRSVIKEKKFVIIE